MSPTAEAPPLAAAVARVLSGRAGMAGVRWLLLAPPGRLAVRRELEGLLAPGAGLGRWRLRRVKFKPGRKLSASYEVSLVGAGDGDRPVMVTWEASPTAMSGGAGARGSALHARALASTSPPPFRALVAERPALGLRVLVSPFDPAFPALLTASDAGHVSEMLRAADVGAGPAAGRRSAYAVETVRYRPGERHVLRYDAVEPGQVRRGRRAVFAKLYRHEAGARSFRTAVATAEWLERCGFAASSARPLAYLPDGCVVLYPQVPGTPLWSRLRHQAPAPVPARHLVRAGATLRLLQGAPAAVTEELAGHEVGEDLRLVARAGEHLQALLPAVAARIDVLLERAGQVHALLPQEAPTFAHGDYKADHLLVTADHLTVIDFDSCRVADPALDLGKFLADLHWWYAGSGQPGLEWAQERFLEGYGPGVAPGRLLRARLYEALVLTKITLRRVRLLDPAWALRTEALVSRAERLLDHVAAVAGADRAAPAPPRP